MSLHNSVADNPVADGVLAPSMESVFDRWAAVYDEQPNPLLALEERYLTPLLPALAGLDVLDAGCGTGRWLHRCNAQHPASLTGTDISTAMLAHARAKLGDLARLHHVQEGNLPVANASTDVILSSFVLSYVTDIGAFAKECARITRAGATVLLSDMHPETAAVRQWKRGFRMQDEHVEVAAQHWPLRTILAAFRQFGFEPLTVLEPCLGATERGFFEAEGKLAEFEDLTTAPAIYILKLQKVTPGKAGRDTGDASSLQLTGARCALGAATAVHSALTIRCGRIAWIGEASHAAASTVDLTGYLLLPGLINAHDHLEFALFPNLGRNADAAPYRNATEWAEEIHRIYASVIAKHLEVPRETRLWWGAIRNLLCGVTTVCHHNALHPEFENEDFPVRVLSRYAWAHSLAIDPALTKKFSAAAPDIPFILHAAEGIDNPSADEIFELERMRLLDERTILVHGLALGREGIALLNRRMASLVSCPTSNRFLFHKTPPHLLLASVHRIALGSDSPLTAAGDLLDEIRCAHRDIGMDNHTVYGMVTTQPAGILHLRHGEGRIRKSAIADLIAVRDIQKTPAPTLAQLSFDQVELVLLAGKVQLASAELYARLPENLREGLQLIDVNGHRRWLRAPLAMLVASAEAILGPGNILLGGKAVHHVSSL